MAAMSEVYTKNWSENVNGNAYLGPYARVERLYEDLSEGVKENWIGSSEDLCGHGGKERALLHSCDGTICECPVSRTHFCSVGISENPIQAIRECSSNWL